MTDTATFAPGSLVHARGREWVVLAESEPDMLVLRPLGGGDDDTTAVLPALESVTAASFPPPTADDLGDASRAGLLRTALRIGFRSSAGPFRSLANIAVEPRAYQYVPLLLALRQETVRILISDDVGIGKTVEAGLVASELLAQGDAQRLAVLCSPALAEQWQSELREKFNLNAELVLPSTATRLSRGLMMNESLYERHPYLVISTDFIKSHTRREEFINHCPELVIVDEAHTAVADGAGAGAGSRTQRFELMTDLAADKTRHLILVTATPHSGKEEGFRNLIGLLDPELRTVNLDDVKGREKLAAHFIQRRRNDIRRYLEGSLDETTAFPSDRLTKEAPYELSPEYAAFFDRVLAYAREQVTDSSDGVTAVRQRVRWWSALALLRTLASSPRAAAETLRNRAKAADASTPEEADSLGRASVLDQADDEALEGLDVAPGAIESDEEDEDGAESDAAKNRRRLLDLARTADKLDGPKADRKLALLITELKALLADGYDPIVFCRYIGTANYVADHLAGSLGNGVSVAAVTGELPPEMRAGRIAELTADDNRHVLVATDCLSEGVNLQADFQAVVHYDLAWNPTRHEQREGRVDRFGQPRDIVKAVMIYGRNNRIDGIVLEVLLRKHREIRKTTGVSVPVPDESDSLVEALLEGLILRGKDDTEQMSLDLGDQRRKDQLFADWESAAERERTAITKYAQVGIRPEEIAREVRAARAALGTHEDVELFAVSALRALNAPVSEVQGGYEVVSDPLPIGLRDAFSPILRQPLSLRREVPVGRDAVLLARTDPTVGAVARHVLDVALDPKLGAAVATRAGVARTSAVTTRTTVLLVRFRFHLELPARDGIRRLVSEEARFLAFTGRPDTAEWLDVDAANRLSTVAADANLSTEQAADLANQFVDELPALDAHLSATAESLAEELLDAHQRVRSGAKAATRGLKVEAQKPADVLGFYIWLPVAN